eukprot:6054793-Pyramimonas_sp.AAC.1
MGVFLGCCVVRNLLLRLVVNRAHCLQHYNLLNRSGSADDCINLRVRRGTLNSPVPSICT